MSGDQDLAIDQLRSTVAALSDQQQRDAAAATFFADHALPVVEGNLCTFATRAAADSVYLRHRVNLWPDDLEFAPLPGTDVWFLTIELERGARVEYQFEIVRNREWWRFNDPYNPRLARSPLGDCSVCCGPGYATPDWATFRADTDPGQLVERQVHSPAQGRDNRVTVYLPAGFETSMRYPLLVVHDGGDYLGYASMKIVLDNLIQDEKLAKIIAVFSYPGERLTEYPNDPDHAKWITCELLPDLERQFPLLTDPSGRCLMGTSFGAVSALSTAVRFPGTYGSLLLQSGSFLYSDPRVRHGEGADFDPVVRFIDHYRAHPVRAAERAFISCGAYEDLVDANAECCRSSVARGWRSTTSSHPMDTPGRHGGITSVRACAGYSLAIRQGGKPLFTDPPIYQFPYDVTAASVGKSRAAAGGGGSGGVLPLRATTTAGDS